MPRKHTQVPDQGTLYNINTMEWPNATSVLKGSGIEYSTPMTRVHLELVNCIRCYLETVFLLHQVCLHNMDIQVNNSGLFVILNFINVWLDSVLLHWSFCCHYFSIASSELLIDSLYFLHILLDVGHSFLLEMTTIIFSPSSFFFK